MELRTKLVLGFAAVILVMVALGATAFVMFRRVDSNIDAVNRDSLPAVSYSTDGRSALEAILEEKNRLLFKAPDIYARAKGKLGQLSAIWARLTNWPMPPATRSCLEIFGNS